MKPVGPVPSDVLNYVLEQRRVPIMHFTICTDIQYGEYEMSCIVQSGGFLYAL